MEKIKDKSEYSSRDFPPIAELLIEYRNKNVDAKETARQIRIVLSKYGKASQEMLLNAVKSFFKLTCELNGLSEYETGILGKRLFEEIFTTEDDLEIINTKQYQYHRMMRVLRSQRETDAHANG